MKEDITYISGGNELLDYINPLWEQLNRHHADVSAYFSETYFEKLFSSRKEELVGKAWQGKLRVDLARSEKENRYIGYCISTINRDKVGEIDSIFVDELYRRTGIGFHLMESALGWLDGENVESKVVVVAYGNEKAFLFYGRFGFFPRATTLLQRQST